MHAVDVKYSELDQLQQLLQFPLGLFCAGRVGARLIVGGHEAGVNPQEEPASLAMLLRRSSRTGRRGKDFLQPAAHLELGIIARGLAKQTTFLAASHRNGQDIARPGLHRLAPLVLVFVNVVDAGNAAETAAGVVSAFSVTSVESEAAPSRRKTLA